MNRENTILTTMSRLFRTAQNPPARASAAASLDAAAALPNSGLAFVDNAQGASAAVGELSRTLDDALAGVVRERSLGATLAAQVDRLDEAAARYANSQFAGGDAAKAWAPAAAEARVVAAAWECAAAAYEAGDGGRFTLEVEEVDRTVVSVTGVRRVACFWIVRDRQGDSKWFPMLVVAVRGTITSSVRDHIVNANGRGEPADWLLSDGARVSTEAHAGFLSAAKALEPKVFENMTRLIRLKDSDRYKDVKHVLFTGHSAGGAVSSLLFLRYILRASKAYPDIRFSSITFGSPPVVGPKIADLIPHTENRGLVLSVVNEYDLVPRTDAAYIRSLVDLYRSIYNLPPIQYEDAQKTQHAPNMDSWSISSSEITDIPCWSLPDPDFWHIGQLVLLKMSFPDLDDDDTLNDELLLNAFQVTPEDYAGLLFCRTTVHSRATYEDRIKLLLQKASSKSGHTS